MSTGYWDRLALVAAAAEGSDEAVEVVLSSEDLTSYALASQLGPSLALAARRRGLEGPAVDSSTGRLRSSATSWLLVAEAARHVFAALAATGFRWVPIKGFDVGTRFYPSREERPLSDLDVLVERAGLEASRAALTASGWTSRETSPLAQRFVAEEGYTYHYSGFDSTTLPTSLVEIHFRLWGMVPEGLEVEILEAARLEPGDSVSCLRVDPVHAYVVAATHGWTRTPPHDLVDWRDLERISSTVGWTRARSSPAAVIDCARRWSLELPVCLSAQVAARVWPGSVHGEIARALEPTLRPIERRQLRRLREEGLDAMTVSRVVLARLLAGRSSRAGWRSVWRRVWAHPGVVELETSDDLSWSRRRWDHLRRSLTGA